mgnify:CR=1 FL=1
MSIRDRYKGGVWRGVKGDLKDKYPDGERVWWWAFSSCTKKVKHIACGCYGSYN